MNLLKSNIRFGLTDYFGKIRPFELLSREIRRTRYSEKPIWPNTWVKKSPMSGSSQWDSEMQSEKITTGELQSKPLFVKSGVVPEDLVKFLRFVDIIGDVYEVPGKEYYIVIPTKVPPATVEFDHQVFAETISVKIESKTNTGVSKARFEIPFKNTGAPSQETEAALADFKNKINRLKELSFQVNDSIVQTLEDLIFGALPLKETKTNKSKMCKILSESEKKQLFKETKLIEKLTGKKIVLESKKDCTCCSTKKALTEGFSKLGSKADLSLAKTALKAWKDKYYDAFGGDDNIIRSINELMNYTKK